MADTKTTKLFRIKTRCGYYTERPNEYPALDCVEADATQLPYSAANHLASCLPSDYRPILLEEV